jgi:hypothetical protein
MNMEIDSNNSMSDKEKEMALAKFKLDLDKESGSVQDMFYKGKNRIVDTLTNEHFKRDFTLEQMKQLLNGIHEGKDLDEIEKNIITQVRNLHANEVPDVDFAKMASDQDRAGHWTGGAVD